MKEVLIHTEQDMMKLGEFLGKRLPNQAFIFLSGELGAGKTTLTKGIARGMEIDEPITSPTFQLQKTYRGRNVLRHLDLYRLQNIVEVEAIDPDSLLEDGVTVVEWGELLKKYLRPEYIAIDIFYNEDPSSRRIVLDAQGETYQHIVEDINAYFGT